MTIQDLHDANFLEMAVIDILPNPVLVKDTDLRYVLVNKAFESLFSICRHDLIGKLDKDVFKERQAVQCNAGDQRVLELGEIDEAFETIFRADSEPRETVTRKSRLTLPNGQVFLVGVMHDITEVSRVNRKLQENQKLLQQQSAALQRMANTDPLTGCSNRRALSLYAPRIFAEHSDVGSLLVLDIDYFKRINDTYGHDVGDALLVHFVRIIGRIIRGEDTLVRLGGEEFAIVLPGATLEAARSIAERIRQTVETTPMFHAGSLIDMTVSIGVVHGHDRESINLRTMLAQGDRCLYQAKKSGRNQVVCANSLANE